MCPLSKFFFFIAVVALPLVRSPASASLVVESWGLETGIIAPNDQVFDVSYEVQNPFDITQSASVGPSIATTSFHLAWSDSGGHFRSDAAHQAEDSSPPILRSLSSGSIVFSSTQDLLFTLDAAYSYRLPVNMAADLVVGVSDYVTHEEFMAHSQDAFSPSTGTIEFQDQVLLPAGREYLFLYRMDVDAYGTSGLFGTGSGHVNFTLQPIPEPSTAALLALGFLAARAHRSRRL